MQEADFVPFLSNSSDRYPDLALGAKPEPKFSACLRGVVYIRHCGRRTQQTYCLWIKGFIFFHNKWHPADMAQAGINAFLNHMAVKDRVSASTQTQVLSAVLGQQSWGTKEDCGFLPRNRVDASRCEFYEEVL